MTTIKEKVVRFIERNHKSECYDKNKKKDLYVVQSKRVTTTEFEYEPDIQRTGA